MKNKLKKITAVTLVASMVFTNVAYAKDNVINKNETVYVLKEDNKIKDKNVSVWLNSDSNITGKDKTNLKDIKNLETDKEIKSEDGYINWNEESKDVFYTGKSDKDIPVDVNVEYFLDGKKISNKDLEGKSGHLKIEITSENNESEIKRINGKDKKIYSPYVAINTITFNEDKVKNLKSDDFKIVKDGTNEIASAVLTPGLYDTLSQVLDDKDLEDLKSSATIELDIKDYKPTEFYTVITNELFKKDINIDSIDNLKNEINLLEDNAKKVIDASSQIADGAFELDNGIGKLNDGIKELHNGTSLLKDKTQQAKEEFAALPGRIAPIITYIQMMNKGGKDLANGIDSYTNAVGEISLNSDKLSQGATKIANGTDKLNSGISELKSATGKLKEETSGLSEFKDTADEMKEASTTLEKGLKSFGENYSKLVEANSTLASKSQDLVGANEEFNINMHALNDGLAQMGSLSFEEDAASLESQASNIESVIETLSAQNEDGTFNSQIEALQASAQSLQYEAGVLRQKGQALSKITNISDSVSSLTAASDQIVSGTKQLQGALQEVSDTMSKSKDEMTSSSEKLANGLETLGSKIDTSKLGELQKSIGLLDGATGKIKSGSESLSEATNTNAKAMGKFSGALNELDSNSQSLREGSTKLSSGLNEFQEKSSKLNELSGLEDTFVNPLVDAISRLDNGSEQLDNGGAKLKDGSKQLSDATKEFSDKLSEFGDEGVKKIEDKTQSATEVKEILDSMVELSKKNNSFTGEEGNFESTTRIIEKIK